MKRVLQCLTMLLGSAWAMSSLCADITFYELESFRGRSFVANQSISNFGNIGFNDRASSVIVRGGSWQLCTDAYFRGRCVTINPGEYPSLRSLDLENRVSSARELEWLGGGRPPGGGGGARVELFDGYDYGGRSFAVNGAVSNMADVGFNDRAQSMIVHSGTWELCEDAFFSGRCRTLDVGRYPNLAQFGGRLSSIRQVGGGGGGGGGPVVGGWGTGSRAVLYEGVNMSGRAFVINNEVASNLGSTGFNDRASSLRVEAGYWVFCSDANFGGECRTFGPGDYATLPPSLSNRISSGRRIHRNYPYSQAPEFQYNQQR